VGKVDSAPTQIDTKVLAKVVLDGSHLIRLQGTNNFGAIQVPSTALSAG
jgi:hypothetical protein